MEAPWTVPRTEARNEIHKPEPRDSDLGESHVEQLIGPKPEPPVGFYPEYRPEHYINISGIDLNYPEANEGTINDTYISGMRLTEQICMNPNSIGWLKYLIGKLLLAIILMRKKFFEFQADYKKMIDENSQLKAEIAFLKSERMNFLTSASNLAGQLDIISKNNLKIEKINDDLRKKCSQLEDKLEEKTEKYNRLGTMYDKLFNDYSKSVPKTELRGRVFFCNRCAHKTCYTAFINPENAEKLGHMRDGGDNFIKYAKGTLCKFHDRCIRTLCYYKHDDDCDKSKDVKRRDDSDKRRDESDKRRDESDKRKDDSDKRKDDKPKDDKSKDDKPTESRKRLRSD